MTFQSLIAVLLCCTVPVAVFAAETGYSVHYDGGSLADTKSGSSLKLYLDGDQIRFVKDKANVVSIPASAVTEISYGQDVHRRVGAAIGVGVFTLGLGALMA